MPYTVGQIVYAKVELDYSPDIVIRKDCEGEIKRLVGSGGAYWVNFAGDTRSRRALENELSLRPSAQRMAQLRGR